MLLCSTESRSDISLLLQDISPLSLQSQPLLPLIILDNTLSVVQNTTTLLSQAFTQVSTVLFGQQLNSRETSL